MLYKIKKYARRVMRVFKRVHNLIRWTPVIWNDFDWDSGFIYSILKFKLKNVLADTKNWNMLEDRKKMIIEDLQICIKLIESVAEETYAMEPHEYMKTNMVLTEGPDTPAGCKEMNIVYTDDKLDTYFLDNIRRYRMLSTGKETTIEERAHLARRIAEAKQEHAKKLLFKILHDRIDYWWD